MKRHPVRASVALSLVVMVTVSVALLASTPCALGATLHGVAHQGCGSCPDHGPAGAPAGCCCATPLAVPIASDASAAMCVLRAIERCDAFVDAEAAMGLALAASEVRAPSRRPGSVASRVCAWVPLTPMERTLTCTSSLLS